MEWGVEEVEACGLWTEKEKKGVYQLSLQIFLGGRNLERIIHAPISSRLDYGNVLYAAINKSLLARLYSVHSVAAWFLTSSYFSPSTGCQLSFASILRFD